MQIIYKGVNEITPYEKNPRKNEEAVDYVANSIKEFGFKVPIIIDKNNVIVTGHTRLKAAKKLGMQEVPVILADDLTDEQIKAFRLADNKVAEYATWDDDLLKMELGDLDLDMSEFGFDLDMDIPEEEIIQDEVPDIPEEPKSKLGQVYQLGNHRLMCGDSTKLEDVDKLMNGIKADLLFTDPPYNVDVSNSQGMKIKNDNMDNESFKTFLYNSFHCASESLKDGGAFYIWHADSETVNFRTQCEENDLNVKQCLIWVKNGFNFGRQDYKWKHEPCLYGWKEGAGHYFVEEYNHPTVIEDEIDLDKMKKEEMRKLLEELLADQSPTTVIHENKPLKNDLHPTMKPIKMCADMIRNSSKKQEIVLDLFGGSGSTLITCEQLKRTCYMMEYDPVYVDVIIERWENFTGEKAVLISD